MNATQYKVHYSKHGQEEVEVFSDIAEVGSIENGGFKILKITPQMVVDQIGNSDELLSEARKEAAYMRNKAELDVLYQEFDRLSRAAAMARVNISMAILRRKR